MSDEQLREDELVSAYLDGEATPAEIAEVEQDDALMARVEQLRSVRDAVAAPVAPVSTELRDQMIGVAIAVADAETAQRTGARIVPIHRRRETLLAVAAAAILLAAVVSAGVIASRGGDDEMATESTAALDADDMSEAAPVATAALAEADTASADEDADHEMAAEPMPEEEPMAGEAATAAEEAALADMAAGEPDEAAIAELGAALAEAETEAAVEALAEEPADTTQATGTDEADQQDEEERRTADDAARRVVDLGPFESLQSLFDTVSARWSAALEDGTTADSGTCSAAVDERTLEFGIETAPPFIATVGAEDPLIYDARFARRADGTATIIYAAPPSCETGTFEQDESDGS